MDKPLKILFPKEMVELILKSIEDSDLFRSDWDKYFVKIVLEMYLTKGDFSHFIEYYGRKTDLSDFQTYFKETIINRYGEDIYFVMEDELYGDDDER